MRYQMDMLQKYLENPGNSYAKLATALGYKCSGTIYNWIHKLHRVPMKVWPEVLELIQKDERKRAGDKLRTRRKRVKVVGNG